jgi:hypothetical protein
MQYQFAVAIVEKIIRDHCNAIQVRGELLHDDMTPEKAKQEVEVIKRAYEKVRNG